MYPTRPRPNVARLVIFAAVAVLAPLLPSAASPSDAQEPPDRPWDIEVAVPDFVATVTSPLGRSRGISGDTYAPSITDDGRFATVHRWNADDTIGLYLQDLQAGTSQFIASSNRAMVSGDGSTVVTGRTVHDVATGTSVTIPAPAGFTSPSMRFEPQGISDDGTRVLLWAEPNGTVYPTGLFVADVAATPITFVPVLTKDRNSTHRDVLRHARLSGDGNAVAAIIDHDIYGERTVRAQLWDVSDPAAGAVPTWQEFMQENAWLVTSLEPHDPIGISDDGQTIAYLSRIRDQDSSYELRVHDRRTGVTDTWQIGDVPSESFAEPHAAFSGEVAISGDGNIVVVEVEPTYGHRRYGRHLYALDRTDGAMSQVTVPHTTDADITTSTPESAPALSFDGSALVFLTQNTGLVAPGSITTDVAVPGLYLIATPDDATPPVWPAGGELSIDGVGSSFVNVSWPEATDDGDIAGYQVYLDGVWVLETGPGARTATLDGLQPATEYAISVQANDTTGLSSPFLAAVVTTAALEAGVAPLAAVANEDGSVSLTWDPVDDADGYVVSRTIGGDPVVAGEPTDARFDDVGIPAETDVTYRVDAIVDGETVPHTVDATVTTVGVSAPTMAWTAPRMRGRVGDLGAGGTIDVTVTGQPGRAGDITVGTEATDGTTSTSVIDLTEADPGSYAASFVIPEGTAQVLAMTGRLHDGAGHQASVAATGLPAAVAGSLRVTFDTDAPLDGYVLDLTSRYNSWSSQQTLSGTDPVVVPAPVASDIELHLWRPDGVEANTLPRVVVEPGVITDVELTTLHAAELAITVIDQDGNPLQDIKAHVNADGSNNATLGISDADGRVTSTGWTNRLDAAIRLTSDLVPIEDDPATIVALDPGTNEVTVAADVIADGAIVNGLVRSFTGDPVPHVTVTLTQFAGDLPVVRTATTGENGEFAITGYHGPARITVGDGWGGSVDVVIGATPLYVTIEATTARPDIVEIDLRVQGPEDTEWSPPLSLDAATVREVELGAEVVDPDGSTIRTRLRELGGNRFGVAARPGSTVRICADAQRWNGGAGCSDPVTTAGDGRIHAVDLRLRAEAAVELSVVDAFGNPVTGSWSVTFSALDGDRFSAVYSAAGQTLATALPGAGDYAVTIRAPGRAALRSTITVGSGMVTRTTLQLPAGGGRFAGPGNTLTAMQPGVMAGGIVTFRAEYTLGAGSDLAEATYVLELPPGWSPVPAGVAHDGVPTEVTTDGDEVRVALGDLRAGDSGVLHVPVEVPADALAGSTVTVVGDIAYLRSVYGIAHGSAAVEIVGVTIEAPDTISEASAHVSGYAPPGAVVTVTGDGAPVGLALAAPNGRWNVRAVLPERPVGSTYELRASVEGHGHLAQSEPATVTFDPTRPVLTEVVLTQNNYQVRRPPREDTMRPLFVLDFTTPMSVQLYFDNPDYVTKAMVRTTGIDVEATRSPDGSFTALFPTYGTHPIWYWWESEPIPLRPDSPGVVPENPEDLLPLLPPGLGDTENVETEHDADGDRTMMTISADLPALARDGKTPRISLTVTGTPVPDYVPSQASAEEARRIGLGIYDPHISMASNGLSGSASGVYIPPTDSTGASTPGVHFFAPAQVSGVRTSIRVAWEITNGADDLKDAFSMYGGDKYKRLDRLRERVAALKLCNPYWDLNDLNSQIDDLAEDVLAFDLLTTGMMAAGFAAGTVTFGLGFAVSVGGWLLEKAVESALDERIESFETTVRDWLREDGCDAQMAPMYVVDPSGYVYEATEDNRLAGVTATALHASTPDGPWQVWESAPYEQQNPLSTTDDGRYAWDVPPGYWQVKYEHDGYATAFSDVLEVPPPHFDVNVGLVSTDAPVVSDVDGDGGIEIAFSQPMKLDWVQPAVSVVDTAAAGIATAGPPSLMAAGAPSMIPGTVEAIDAATTPDGDTVAARFRFVPDTTPDDGTELTVTIDTLARNYGDRPLPDTHTATITFAAAPDDDGDGTGTDPDDDGDSNDPDDHTGPGTGNGPGNGDGTDTGSNGGPRLPGAPGSPSGALPRTGTSPDLARLGALLVVAGAAMVTTGRRRRRHP